MLWLYNSKNVLVLTLELKTIINQIWCRWDCDSLGLAGHNPTKELLDLSFHGSSRGMVHFSIWQITLTTAQHAYK